MRLVVLICLLALPGAARAANFCGDGASRMSIGSGAGPTEDLTALRKMCRPGESITLPGNETFIIASLCDFSKGFYTAPNGTTTCIVAP